MYQVTVTITATIPPVIVVCSGASLITMTVIMAPTSVGQTTSDQHDVVLPPQWILREAVRGSVSLTTMPEHQQPQSQMPSQAFVNYTMGPLLVSFSFRGNPPTNSLCHMLVSVMVFAFCCQIPILLPCSPKGVQP